MEEKRYALSFDKKKRSFCMLFVCVCVCCCWLVGWLFVLFFFFSKQRALENKKKSWRHW